MKPFKLSGLILFDILSWEYEYGKKWAVSGGTILAKTKNDAFFLIDFIDIKCEKLGVLINRSSFHEDEEDEEDNEFINPFNPQIN